LFGGGSIDAQAQAHYDRVIADGGVVPAGVSGVNGFFTAVKTLYATSDITTAISVGLDAHYLGYKLGAGSGTTLGQAAQKLYSCAGSSGDVVQTTATSQPLLLVYEDVNYWFGSGVSGNYLETPNASANQIVGDIDIKAQTNKSTNPAVSNLISKWDATGAYYLGFNNGSLVFVFNGGGAFTQSTVADPYVDGVIHWVRVTRNATTGDVIFYTSANGSTWVQLGTTVSTAAGNMNASNDTVRVGARDTGGANGAFNGKIYRATISNTIGGTPVVDFNPATYNASTSQTQWTSTTGEVWTINTGTATSGYKGALVDRTIVQSDGVDDRLTSGTLTSRTSFTVYIAVNVLSFSGRFMDGSSALTKMLYGTSSNISMFGGSGGFDFVGETPQRLQMLTANFQAAPNIYARINNNTRATTATSIGSAASTGINLFTDGGGTNPANVMINTIIQSTTNDPLNDAIYNYIRSLNNNAF
jgi:hypothetical protein